MYRGNQTPTCCEIHSNTKIQEMYSAGEANRTWRWGRARDRMGW